MHEARDRIASIVQDYDDVSWEEHGLGDEASLYSSLKLREWERVPLPRSPNPHDYITAQRYLDKLKHRSLENAVVEANTIEDLILILYLDGFPSRSGSGSMMDAIDNHLGGHLTQMRLGELKALEDRINSLQARASRISGGFSEAQEVMDLMAEEKALSAMTFTQLPLPQVQEAYEATAGMLLSASEKVGAAVKLFSETLAGMRSSLEDDLEGLSVEGAGFASKLRRISARLEKMSIPLSTSHLEWYESFEGRIESKKQERQEYNSHSAQLRRITSKIQDLRESSDRLTFQILLPGCAKLKEYAQALPSVPSVTYPSLEESVAQAKRAREEAVAALDGKWQEAKMRIEQILQVGKAYEDAVSLSPQLESRAYDVSARLGQALDASESIGYTSGAEKARRFLAALQGKLEDRVRCRENCNMLMRIGNRFRKVSKPFRRAVGKDLDDYALDVVGSSFDSFCKFRQDLLGMVSHPKTNSQREALLRAVEQAMIDSRNYARRQSALLERFSTFCEGKYERTRGWDPFGRKQRTYERLKVVAKAYAVYSAKLDRMAGDMDG